VECLKGNALRLSIDPDQEGDGKGENKISMRNDKSPRNRNRYINIDVDKAKWTRLKAQVYRHRTDHTKGTKHQKIK